MFLILFLILCKGQMYEIFLSLHNHKFRLMTIVTLTSDWSKGDYYTGALKGMLLSLDGGIEVVEISKSITPFDVLQEVFILKNTYRFFPVGSIHLMGVMSEPSPDVDMIVVYSDGHYFIGVNDGRFSLLLDSVPAIAFSIVEDIVRNSFSSLGLFVKGVKTIMGNSFNENTVAAEVKIETSPQLVYSEESITGRVVYIDSFGNAITNIEKTLFDKIHRGRNFTIFVAGPYSKIRKISSSYFSHDPGEIFALFNSLGLLEIAVYQGNIAVLENIDTSTEIKIRFENSY
ncbi:MAG TPA: hypothetical protein DEO33_02665 [Rikenellaceae bacterium]|nr:hypothetical protein [Rikenellaceae bacterium]